MVRNANVKHSIYNPANVEWVARSFPLSLQLDAFTLQDLDQEFNREGDLAAAISTTQVQ